MEAAARDHCVAADDRVSGGPAAAQVDQLGAYLTDEVFLYRVADLLMTGAGEMVELEDCYGLDVVRVPVDELRDRRLRVVAPTPLAG